MQPISSTPFSSSQLLPREFGSARIGSGTVRTQIDRSLRVRFEGTGPASQRDIVPDSAAAARLMASPSGEKFTSAVRSIISVADAHEGKENLKSLTFTPDEKAVKGVEVLNWAAGASQHVDLSQMIEPDEQTMVQVRELAKIHKPGASEQELRAQIRAATAQDGVQQLTEDVPSTVAFSAAWNGDGHIVMMPDESRNVLATLGLYRTKPGDSLTRLPPSQRAAQVRESWDTAIHETHHSITPSRQVRNPEWTRVMEEAVSEVLAPSQISPTIKAAGGDVSLAARPARNTKNDPVDWPAWNRSHLPRPPASEVATAKGRYTDGPELVGNLLKMAGLDRRTTEGKQLATDLLQGENSSRVPRKLAEAIGAQHELPAERTEALTKLIRKAAIGQASMGDINALVKGS